jgi:hypothetical protein
MRRWQKIAPALAAMVTLAAALASCRGDGGNDTNESPTAASDERTQPAATVTADAATAPPDESPSAEANADDLDTLRQVRDRFIGSTFTATYENRGQTAVEFVPVRIFKDGESRYRVDFVGEREGQPYSGISIVDEGTGYICGTGELARLIGGDEAGACVRDPGGTGNPIEALFGAFTVDESLRIVERSERQVAGRIGQCYTTEHTASGARGTICTDSSGALLAIESADPTGTNIIASDVTDSVTDADFTPPYEVRELPDSGG